MRRNILSDQSVNDTHNGSQQAPPNEEKLLLDQWQKKFAEQHAVFTVDLEQHRMVALLMFHVQYCEGSIDSIALPERNWHPALYAPLLADA
eukprot:3966318-Amphidinium_carterae.1